MNYQEALAYLYSLSDFERGGPYTRNPEENLPREAWLLEHLGNPQQDYSSTLIAGTKGKGSTAAVIEHIQEQGRFGPFITYEVATALALLYFSRQRIDHAVLEVGLGGRLDATNVTQPLVSVITSISYDHMQILGNTLREIATEKAGIVKPHGIVVTSAQPVEAL